MDSYMAASLIPVSTLCLPACRGAQGAGQRKDYFEAVLSLEVVFCTAALKKIKCSLTCLSRYLCMCTKPADKGADFFFWNLCLPWLSLPSWKCLWDSVSLLHGNGEVARLWGGCRKRLCIGCSHGFGPQQRLTTASSFLSLGCCPTHPPT